MSIREEIGQIQLANVLLHYLQAFEKWKSDGINVSRLFWEKKNWIQYQYYKQLS